MKKQYRPNMTISDSNLLDAVLNIKVGIRKRNTKINNNDYQRNERTAVNDRRANKDTELLYIITNNNSHSTTKQLGSFIQGDPKKLAHYHTSIVLLHYLAKCR